MYRRCSHVNEGSTGLRGFLPACCTLLETITEGHYPPFLELKLHDAGGSRQPTGLGVWPLARRTYCAAWQA